ncbi:MAG: hypothetical protein MJZ08_00605 [Bacteroidaceae bacterium]|nr:hypothetical protein [Bacteroidaceae bacterium]
MSKKANVRRQRYAEKQEQKGKNVVIGIIAVLIILALIYMFTTISSL